MVTKELVKTAIEDLGETFSIDELIEKLLLAESFENGKKEYDLGLAISHEEVGKNLEKWLK